VAGSVVLAGSGLGDADDNSAASDVPGDCAVAVPARPDAPDGIGADVPPSCVSAIASDALTVVTV
jgi:hypothetical protein